MIRYLNLLSPKNTYINQYQSTMVNHHFRFHQPYQSIYPIEPVLPAASMNLWDKKPEDTVLPKLMAFFWNRTKLLNIKMLIHIYFMYYWPTWRATTTSHTSWIQGIHFKKTPGHRRPMRSSMAKEASDLCRQWGSWGATWNRLLELNPPWPCKKGHLYPKKLSQDVFQRVLDDTLFIKLIPMIPYHKNMQHAF